MSVQKQRGETRTPSTDTSGQHGNASAKIAADNVQAILAKTVEPLDIRADVENYLRNSITEPDTHGNGGGNNVLSVLPPHKLDYLFDHIAHSEIDPKTLQWFDRDYGRNSKICICLTPSCHIGPFIPVRT